jgi:hypothetical protein
VKPCARKTVSVAPCGEPASMSSARRWSAVIAMPAVWHAGPRLKARYSGMAETPLAPRCGLMGGLAMRRTASPLSKQLPSPPAAKRGGGN